MDNKTILQLNELIYLKRFHLQLVLIRYKMFCRSKIMGRQTKSLLLRSLIRRGARLSNHLISLGLNSINMADLGRGVYNVNVSQADGNRTTYKILKL